MYDYDTLNQDFPELHKLTREQVVDRIIDLMFDMDNEPSPEIYVRFSEWLLDPHDSELKDRALFKIFNSYSESNGNEK